LAKRWGNTLLEPVKWWRLPDLMQIAGTVYQEYLAAEEKPDEICVDVIGFGAGVVDRLNEMGLPVTGINVAESPSVRVSSTRSRRRGSCRSRARTR